MEPPLLTDGSLSTPMTAVLPSAPVILDPTAPDPPAVLDEPIGAAVPGNAGVFSPSAAAQSRNSHGTAGDDFLGIRSKKRLA